MHDKGDDNLRIGAINLLKVRDGFDLHSGVACRVGTGEPGIEVQIGHRKPYKCREVPVQGHGFLWHDTLVTVHEQCGHLHSDTSRQETRERNEHMAAKEDVHEVSTPTSGA